MCQLLGMNCNVPTDICFSFEGFSRRGGETDHHSDGWGIAFFEHTGCRMFLDDKPSATSPIAQLVKNYPIHSINVIAHIRKATCGRVALENTHPFQRELWGQYWVFAHNGTLKDFAPPPQ
ncbi:MAG TPA: class II glutamine amidotransferase, partial [Burkholderiales bacterium]|nr:class II glutamine amidotransferase [Burkholderiales bacterium]